jgi:hypothetical protein
VVCSANSATEPIQKGAVGIVLDRIAPTPGGVGGDELGQGMGNGGGVLVGGDLGIEGHGVGVKVKGLKDRRKGKKKGKEKRSREMRGKNRHVMRSK